MSFAPMAVSANSSAILVQARQKFRSGVVVAAIPVGAQVTIGALLIFDKSSFPNADEAVMHPAFWLMQLILLCIAVCGNTIVDFVAAKNRDGLRQDRIFYIIFFFSIILVTVVVAMLDPKLDWRWLSGVTISGALCLFLAYLVEMDLATAEEKATTNVRAT